MSNGIKHQITAYFEDLINAVNTRKAELLTQVDVDINTVSKYYWGWGVCIGAKRSHSLGVSLQGAQHKTSNNVDLCDRVMNSAMHTYSLDETLGLHILQVCYAITVVVLIVNVGIEQGSN